MADRVDLRDAAVRLREHIIDQHWRPPLLIGPDPGIRWNARLGRFAKSYARRIGWHDDLVYAQAQKYWIHANLILGDLGWIPKDAALSVASACASGLRARQKPEGYWEYPNPEWAGRIATVEGNYAGIGMLLAYERTNDPDLLEGAIAWYDYAVNEIGFQPRGATIAINYFGNVAGSRIPNNSASAVRAFAMLAKAAGDDSYLEYCGPMVAFMADTQLGTGELPYAVRGVTGRDRIHFLCNQYNAFEFLNIAEYWQLTGDKAAEPLLEHLSRFLQESLNLDGSTRYDCSHDSPEVVYYSGAIAAAMQTATALGIGEHEALVDRATVRLLSHQGAAGGFPYSLGNYRYLNDRRSYPRYLSMILTHLGSVADLRSGRSDT